MILVIAFITAGVASFIAGVFGSGASLITVPILNHILRFQHVPNHYTMHVAIGTTLAFGFILFMIASYAQHKKGAIDWHVFSQLLWPTIIGVLVGSFLAAQVSGIVLRVSFGLFLLLLATWSIFKKGENQKPWSRQHWSFKFGIFMIAIIVGFIGAGILTIPFLRKYGFSLLASIAMTLALGTVTALFGTLSYIVTGWHEPGLPASCIGYVDWSLLLPLAAGSAVFARLGVKASHQLHPRLLHYLFCTFLFIISVKMLWL
jgi:uncharacterized membrane protein YfcA